ncbi:Sarcalumeninlike, partial [Caligus rogercresseyi]
RPQRVSSYKGFEKKPAPKPKKKVYKSPSLRSQRSSKKRNLTITRNGYLTTPPEVRSRLTLMKSSTYPRSSLINPTSSYKAHSGALKDIQSSVEPLETLFKYRELSNRPWRPRNICQAPRCSHGPLVWREVYYDQLSPRNGVYVQCI